MMVSKWWQSFNFWVKYSFKQSPGAPAQSNVSHTISQPESFEVIMNINSKTDFFTFK